MTRARTSKYPEIALMAADASALGKSPTDAWEDAAALMYPDNLDGHNKGCPKTTFLGLAEAGHIKNAPPGVYAPQAHANKAYALRTLRLLGASPSLTHQELWRKVTRVEELSKQNNGKLHW